MGSTGRMTIAIFSCYVAGFVGSLFIAPDAAAWYARLSKPSLTPSNWVFFPVWMVLYGLMGIAFGRIWSKTPLWYAWNGLFCVSLAFNAAWVMFFFGYHTIFIALADLACLVVLLITLILHAWEIDRFGTYLLLPYLGWVIFAGYLNTGIFLLN